MEWYRQVSDDDASDGRVEILIGVNKGEIRVTTMVQEAHMHSTIEHDSLAIDGYHHTTLPNFLTSAWKQTM